MMASACLHPLTYWSGVCDACAATSGLVRAASEQGLVEALVPLGWAFPGWGYVLCPSCAQMANKDALSALNLGAAGRDLLTSLHDLVDRLLAQTRAAVRAATEAPE